MSDQLCTFPVALLAKEKGFQKFKSSENIEGEFFFYNNFGVIDSNYYKKGLGSKLGAMLNDKNVGAKWSNSCEAPTQTELQKWLRETHKIFVSVDFDPEYHKTGIYSADVRSLKEENLGEKLLDGFSLFTNYDEALEEGLHQTLKLIQ